MLLLFSTLINLNIHGSSRNMYLYYFNESDNKFKRLTAQAFFITYCLSEESYLLRHRAQAEKHIKHIEYVYGINWLYYVHSIHVLCLGDSNYVSSGYWQTLRCIPYNTNRHLHVQGQLKNHQNKIENMF